MACTNPRWFCNNCCGVSICGSGPACAEEAGAGEAGAGVGSGRGGRGGTWPGAAGSTGKSVLLPRFGRTLRAGSRFGFWVFFMAVLVSTGRLVVATAFEPKKLWDDRCHSNDVYDCQLLMVLPMVSLLSETDSLFLKGYDLHVSTPSRSFGLQSSLAERITLMPTILRLRFLSYEMNLTVCI